MSSPTQGLLRGLRAGSLGVVGFVLTLVAHVAAGVAHLGRFGPFFWLGSPVWRCCSQGFD